MRFPAFTGSWALAKMDLDLLLLISLAVCLASHFHLQIKAFFSIRNSASPALCGAEEMHTVAVENWEGQQT